MSEEQFLARWSRRKQDADNAELAPKREQGSAPSDCAAAEPALPETDLSHLPPIESIDAATDITAFLSKGIPQELGRAALRRAWSADPAIRDFVGLAENAWDFNDPNAMAGFGPLDYSAEQVDALVRRIVDGVVGTAERLTEPPTEAAEDDAPSARANADFAQSSTPPKTVTEPPSFDESAAAELPTDSAASQSEAAREETSLPRRTHGGALPK
ncbi:DUF3306 domain-containing protein [Bradyrhizobium sp. HKCCYLS1011]|uniref:DUF3306 domain-containing protein n=1 Tax=Bradyrhizobium sp. HKCCYLS1011 TaxID=3420733 RepID=UPI003EBC2630